MQRVTQFFIFSEFCLRKSVQMCSHRDICNSVIQKADSVLKLQTDLYVVNAYAEFHAK